jgi:uncharacterized membrane protein (UPF0127 family)
MTRRLTIASHALLLTSLAAVTGCDPASPNRRQAGSAQSDLPVTTMPIGSRTFTLEIASTDDARAKGLMYRDTMPPDHGMIFVFRNEQPLSFWMKNTRLPLDILYLDATGRVVSIHQMRPLDLTGVTARGLAKYAIELNQGTAAALGVKDGDQLQLPPDVTSIKADASLAP